MGVDIEYLISELIMDTRSIALLEDDVEHTNDPEHLEYLLNHLQLLYVNREMAIEELMKLSG